MKNHRFIFVFMSALYAVVSLCSCSKPEITESEDDNYAFKAGQKVRITVNTSAGADSRVTSSFYAGNPPTTPNYLQFEWETGDQIKVKVGSDSAAFTLVGGSGTSNGNFEGIMPAGGNKFDVQFPYNDVTEADLANQTYVAGGVPHNMMMFRATDCTLSGGVSLVSTYAALKLNLKSGTGFSNPINVGRIVVADSVSHKTFTLNCPGGVLLNTSTAVPFYFVVPAAMMKGSTKIFNWDFDARIYDELNHPLACLKKRNASATFQAGQVLNMEDGHILRNGFTVQKNYVLNFARGNLNGAWEDSGQTKWVWGLENQQYEFPTEWAKWNTHGDRVGHFYWTPIGYPNKSYEETYDGAIPMDITDKIFCGVNNPKFQVYGRSYAAMNKDQWEYLLTSRSNASSLYQIGVTVCHVTGCLLIAPDNYTGTIKTVYNDWEWATAEAEGLVCLPPAGSRTGDSITSNVGYYWIADVDKNEASANQCYYLDISVPSIKTATRDNGYPIRLAFQR